MASRESSGLVSEVKVNPETSGDQGNGAASGAGATKRGSIGEADKLQLPTKSLSASSSRTSSAAEADKLPTKSPSPRGARPGQPDEGASGGATKRPKKEESVGEEKAKDGGVATRKADGEGVEAGVKGGSGTTADGAGGTTSTTTTTTTSSSHPRTNAAAAAAGGQDDDVTVSDLDIEVLELVGSKYGPPPSKPILLKREVFDDFKTAVASVLHDEWRKPRLLPDGTYDPRPKEVAGTIFDIANLSYSELPHKFQLENAMVRALFYSCV